MIKQLVNVEVIIPNAEVYLVTIVGETLAQFQQILGDVRVEMFLQFSFLHILTHAHDVYNVGIFRYLLCKVALRCW